MSQWCWWVSALYALYLQNVEELHWTGGNMAWLSSPMNDSCIARIAMSNIFTWFHDFFAIIPAVDGRNPAPSWMYKTLYSKEISTTNLPQLVSLPDFWLPSTTYEGLDVWSSDLRPATEDRCRADLFFIDGLGVSGMLDLSLIGITIGTHRNPWDERYIYLDFTIN